MSEQRPIDSQKQRWLKYGVNVVLSSGIVIAIAVLVVYFVQQRARRIDTTASGLYSLKPQTVNLIRGNTAPIKLVSLYRDRDDPDASAERERARIVRDLLNEYQRKGKGITVEFIDPKVQPAKEDALIREVEQKYGGEIQAYRTFLDEYEAQHERILKLCSEEVEQLRSLPPLAASEVDRETRQTFREIVDTVDGFPALLDKFKQQIDRERKKKIPDYKLSADLVRGGVEGLSERLTAIAQRLNASRNDQKLPESIRQYMSDSIPRYEAIQQVCQQVIQTLDGLGDLKLDTLRRSLQQRDPILVMGEKDIRILPFDQIWQEQAQRPAGTRGDVTFKPRFAGEQLITTAIMGINQPERRKIAFVRPGGPPLTDPGFPPFQPPGPMSEIAARLRQYNFDVIEKDVSGQWAMQAQMRGMPAGPEPTDEELRSAIWVVLAFPTGGGPMSTAASIGPLLRPHLDAGGAALVLVAPRAEGLNDALADWGIEVRTDLIAVHESIQSPETAGTDELYDARRRQYVFDLRDYGEHPLVRPLRSLESLMVPLLPVVTRPVEGVTATPILPLGGELKVWAESDFDSLQRDEPVTFGEGDLPGPIHAGVVAERQGQGRVVVIGSPTFAFNFELEMPDPDMARQGVYVARFPANGELFMNSIFWLADMEPMIAISPAAMEVSRIRPMSKAALNGWRIGLLLIGIPAAVVASGLLVYFNRRD